MNICNFIEQAHNLSSLSIRIDYSNRDKTDRTIEGIESILPRQLKHLEIPSSNFDQLKMILERCDNLSIIIIDASNRKFYEEVNK
jgi:hypothetical protein